jgi:hypothetical protein
VIKSNTEDSLQKAAHKLNQTITKSITKYGLTIFVQKTKTVVFKGQDPMRRKIVINNTISKQVKT